MLGSVCYCVVSMGVLVGLRSVVSIVSLWCIGCLGLGSCFILVSSVWLIVRFFILMCRLFR